MGVGIRPEVVLSTERWLVLGPSVRGEGIGDDLDTDDDCHQAMGESCASSISTSSSVLSLICVKASDKYEDDFVRGGVWYG